MASGQAGKREPDYRVIRAQEEERKRLARDLHDGLVQSLVGLGINLEMVERHLSSDPVRKAEALTLLGEIREGVATCLEETRRILTDLRPLELNGRSLSQALKEHAERVSKQAGLKVTVVISGKETRLHPSLEAGLFRIFQESLNNICEHAAAREVSLKFRFLARAVWMDIEDDGRGFDFQGDFDQLIRNRHFGLVGINERVKLLGGTWRLHSRPGQGTEVRVRLPVTVRTGFWSLLAPFGGGPEERGAHDGAAETPAAADPSTRAGRPEERSGPGHFAGRASIRVVVADDHRVVREGLKMVIDTASDLEVVAEAADGPALIQTIRQAAPDVVLLDVMMPGPGAVQLIEEVGRLSPHTAVVVLTAHHDPLLVGRLFAAGAAGYLLKSAGAVEIIGAVRAAHCGVRPLAVEALQALAAPGEAARARAAPVESGGATGAKVRELTLREREIVELVGQGLTNEEIADRLFISDKTVRNHLGAILRKLDLEDRTQVALLARGLHPAGPGDD